MKLYAIKDKAMGFNTPFPAQNDYHALRMAADTVNAAPGQNPDSTIQQHPADYDIYYIGELDQNTGKFESDVRFLSNFNDLKVVSKQ